MPHWTQADFSLKQGARLHYYRTGQGDKRPIVLVHGFSDNGLCWTPVAQALEAEYDVIMPDMRSHGLSDRFQPGETLDMAGDVAELIRGLGLAQPVVAGHSMGGGISYELTVRWPELVRALILEDAPFVLPKPQPVAPAENPAANWAAGLAAKTFEQLLEENRRSHPTWPESLQIPMAEAKKQLDPGIVYRLSERIRSDQALWPTSVQTITQPVLLFTGNPALGGMVLPEGVARVRELNPRIQVLNVPNAGHLIRFDQYAVFMEALWAFLRQLPE